MSRQVLPRCLGMVALLFVFVGAAKSQDPTTSDSIAPPKPLILEKNDGELRTRRIHTDKSAGASSQFLLKVSPKNNGSQHLVLGTEELSPNARIPKHKHLIQDEILLIKAEPLMFGSGIRRVMYMREAWYSSPRTLGSA